MDLGMLFCYIFNEFILIERLTFNPSTCTSNFLLAIFTSHSMSMERGQPLKCMLMIIDMLFVLSEIIHDSTMSKTYSLSLTTHPTLDPLLIVLVKPCYKGSNIFIYFHSVTNRYFCKLQTHVWMLCNWQITISF